MSLRVYQSSSHPYQQHNHFSLLRATFYCCLRATLCRTNFLFSASFPCLAQKDIIKNPESPSKRTHQPSETKLCPWIKWWTVTWVHPAALKSTWLVSTFFFFFFERALLKPRSHSIKDCRYTRVRLLREPHLHVFCFRRFKIQLSKGCRYIFAMNYLVLNFRLTLVQLCTLHQF